MAELKTKPSDQNVEVVLNAIQDPNRKQECFTVLELMKQITNETPVLWGDSIIGFGTFKYKYDSGREAEWFLTGFSSRKQNLTLYLMAGPERFPELRNRLGKHKIGKSCLYINKLEDVDLDVLKELIETSHRTFTKKF